MLGTRSTTGQLLPFKKGTFHMWEETRAPIVPVVTIGAFDLYPVGSYVNATGRIFVRYLPPILAKETTDRDQMLRLVRRRVLETLMRAPDQLGAELTWMERWQCFGCSAVVITANALVLRGCYEVLFRRLALSTLEAIGWMSSGSLAITAVVYIYNVYIANM